MHNYGHWVFEHEFDPTEWYGFIYRIIDHNTKKTLYWEETISIKTTKKDRWQKKQKDRVQRNKLANLYKLK